MKIDKKPYRGCRDLFPEDKRIQNYLFSIMQKTAESFGYEPYDGPLLEEVELYKAKSGEELINDQIYAFVDRGERHVAIRPEMTPTVARMIAQIYREQPKPLRWYSIPNLMRYEKPQRGRLREHWQFNCDIFGAPENQGELEILQIIVTLFQNFGANHAHFGIVLNDRQFVDDVFLKLMQLDDMAKHKLYKIVDRAKKVEPTKLQAMLEELNLLPKQRDILNDYLALKSFSDVKDFTLKFNLDQANKRFELLTHFFEELNLNDYFSFDPSIVRGLDYYTGFVFEAFDKHPENRRALCGGGAYGNLLEIFGEGPLAGVGFGLGDVTLRDFLEVHHLLPDFKQSSLDFILASDIPEAHSLLLQIAQILRKKNLNVMLVLEPTKIGKLLTLTGKHRTQFMGFIGNDEFQKKQIQIKNLEKRTSTQFTVEDLMLNSFISV
ncbi:MAG: histidine--tRNA ligase [Bacteriovoracaceae bacterium]|nr:histidine--tRNA ligase [Bacteriovoracaceae bacterium]